MSFSREVKQEIIQIKVKDNQCQLAELAALIRMNGSIQLTNKGLAIKVKFTLGDLARKVYSLIKDDFNLDIEIVVKRKRHFSNYQTIYQLVILPQIGVKIFLKELGLLNKKNHLSFKIKKDFLRKKDYQKAYLRGAFLGGGSVNSPYKGYHLEFRCEHEGFAQDLIKLLKIFDLKGQLNQHQGKYVVYFKSFEQIITILNIIGAYQSLLKMENIYVLKDLKNDVNRKLNFETANLDKTVQAAISQLEDIAIIEEKKGLNYLDKRLKELAILRKKYDYLSLKELGQLLNPPLSKSGVNHRLRRIKKIADKLRGE